MPDTIGHRTDLVQGLLETPVSPPSHTIHARAVRQAVSGQGLSAHPNHQGVERSHRIELGLTPAGVPVVPSAQPERTLDSAVQRRRRDAQQQLFGKRSTLQNFSPLPKRLMSFGGLAVVGGHGRALSC